MNTSPPKAEYLPIDKLRPFEDHPFHGSDYLAYVRRLRRVADSFGITCNTT